MTHASPQSIIAISLHIWLDLCICSSAYTRWSPENIMTWLLSWVWWFNNVTRSLSIQHSAAFALPRSSSCEYRYVHCVFLLVNKRVIHNMTVFCLTYVLILFSKAVCHRSQSEHLSENSKHLTVHFILWNIIIHKW